MSKPLWNETNRCPFPVSRQYDGSGRILLRPLEYAIETTLSVTVDHTMRLNIVLASSAGWSENTI